jgi:glycosyltransferase involved in cell wall biosynthesis
MTRIAILTPLVVDGDAVSHDVVGMYQALVKAGYEAQIFAEKWEISTPKIKHTKKINSFINTNSDILIYHYSVGWIDGLTLLHDLNCRKVIKYHNVTPPVFYEGINSDYVSVCRAGREQIKSIVDLDCDLYLSDSEYNAQELHSQGVSQAKCFVLPPFHHIERLQYIDADMSILDKYQDGKTNVLMVGRLAPNKGHLALIDAFNIYYRHYNNNSRLLIAGKADERLKLYNSLLYKRASSLNLKDAVVFTGEISYEALKAYYLVSQIFMITSQHEGFCVPLVEAMAMKLPIVAYGSSAVPQTVGKTGLVWEELNPHLLAGSVDHIVRNDFVSASLGEMGWRRYKDTFANGQIEARFMEVLENLV